MNSLEIVTEREVYVAGETVTGMLYINVFKPFYCRSLDIQVLGSERSRLLVGAHNRFTWNTFINTKTPVKDCLGHLKVGQYAIPFSFAIAPNMPASYRFENFGSSVEVTYTVSAHCRVRRLFSSRIKCSREVTVNTAALAPAPPQHVDVEQKIKTWIFKNAGVAALSCNVDKNTYQPGDVCHITAKVENRSSETIKEVQLCLVKVVTIRTLGVINRATRHLQQELFKATQPVTLSKGKSMTVVASAFLPHDATPSARSNLVDCEYVLTVQAVTAGSTTSNVELKYPVHVSAVPVNDKTATRPICQSTMGMTPTSFRPAFVDVPPQYTLNHTEAEAHSSSSAHAHAHDHDQATSLPPPEMSASVASAIPSSCAMSYNPSSASASVSASASATTASGYVRYPDLVELTSEFPPTAPPPYTVVDEQVDASKC